MKVFRIESRDYILINILIKLPCNHLVSFYCLKHLKKCPKCGAKGLAQLWKEINKILSGYPISDGNTPSIRKNKFYQEKRIEIYIYLKQSGNKKKSLSQEPPSHLGRTLIRIKLEIKIKTAIWYRSKNITRFNSQPSHREQTCKIIFNSLESQKKKFCQHTLSIK